MFVQPVGKISRGRSSPGAAMTARRNAARSLDTAAVIAGSPLDDPARRRPRVEPVRYVRRQYRLTPVSPEVYFRFPGTYSGETRRRDASAVEGVGRRRRSTGAAPGRGRQAGDHAL